MRFAMMIEAQMGLSYEDQLAVARRAEAAGFEAFFRSDHYASFPGASDQPTTDAWAVLAGIARETTTIGLGALVSPVTFRHPGQLVKMITTVDEMSGGRVEAAFGAGWNEDDHRSLGLAFPPIGIRAEMLEEELAVANGLWTEPDGWSFEGKHLSVSGASLNPRAVDRPGRPRSASGIVRPRIIVGSSGSPRSLRTAVRWADEYNLSSAGPDVAAEKQAKLTELCNAADRDPASLTRSAMVGAMIGADDAEVDARGKALLGALGVADASSDWLEARRARWIMGTPDQARAMVQRFADAGIERIMLQDFLPWDLDMIDQFGAELIGKV